MITKQEFKNWKEKSEKEAKNGGYDIKIINRKFHNFLKFYFIITIILGVAVLLWKEGVLERIPFIQNITGDILHPLK